MASVLIINYNRLFNCIPSMMIIKWKNYWPATCFPLVSYVAYASVTDDDRRRQMPVTVTSLAPYTMCGRASNNTAD